MNEVVAKKSKIKNIYVILFWLIPIFTVLYYSLFITFIALQKPKPDSNLLNIVFLSLSLFIIISPLIINSLLLTVYLSRKTKFSLLMLIFYLIPAFNMTIMWIPVICMLGADYTRLDKTMNISMSLTIKQKNKVALTILFWLTLVLFTLSMSLGGFKKIINNKSIVSFISNIGYALFYVFALLFIYHKVLYINYMKLNMKTIKEQKLLKWYIINLIFTSFINLNKADNITNDQINNVIPNSN